INDFRRAGLLLSGWINYHFFFQAEDGIRGPLVTGVQTCALPISVPESRSPPHVPFGGERDSGTGWREAGTEALDVYSDWKTIYEIGRASCRERGERYVESIGWRRGQYERTDRVWVGDEVESTGGS